MSVHDPASQRKGQDTNYPFKRNAEIQKFNDDPDFQEYKLYDIPYYKIMRPYYFGGVRNDLRIPVSMPHRVIVEANPPRQGYSHLTWQTLNQYYLQRCMNQKQYADILEKCRDICYDAHSVNREDGKFVQTRKYSIFNYIVWGTFFVAIIILGITEMVNLDSKTVKEMYLAVLIAVGISLAMFILLSIVNAMIKPPNRVSDTYEKFLREKLEQYFEELYKKSDGKMKFEISKNPNNALWIEIQIKEKTLQMPYSDHEMQKHINHIQDKDEEPICLIRYVKRGEKESSETELQEQNAAAHNSSKQISLADALGTINNVGGDTNRTEASNKELIDNQKEIEMREMSSHKRKTDPYGGHRKSKRQIEISKSISMAQRTTMRNR